MTPKNFVKFLIHCELKKAISYYGIDGTEEAIRRIYKKMPYIKYQMLKEFFILTNREELWKKMKK